MKRYTKNNHPVITLDAELISKRDCNYFSNPGIFLSPDKLYELEFKTEKGNVTFEVSGFEYNVVEEGMKDKLTFQGYELISFGHYIDIHKVR